MSAGPQGSAGRPVETNPIDPDILAFRLADSDAERAGVMLEAPVGTLLRWREAFERMCDTVGFTAGTDYLKALSSATRARRNRGGFGTMALDGAQSRLLELVDRGEGRAA